MQIRLTHASELEGICRELSISGWFSCRRDPLGASTSLNFWRSAAGGGHQLHLALVQAYAPELNKRCRPHLKPTNKSYRTDETNIKVKGEDKYLYRAVDSTGQPSNSCSLAKRFFHKP